MLHRNNTSLFPPQTKQIPRNLSSLCKFKIFKNCYGDFSELIFIHPQSARGSRSMDYKGEVIDPVRSTI